ncbi:MAG TPA: PAS domain S-box protein [Methylomusa anaerophila]|nr:PAS domain S-box protein [Methylomusa anaerophila]HML88116.1 PAS domain S-box protein [Methylomusa anaerophila]
MFKRLQMEIILILFVVSSIAISANYYLSNHVLRDGSSNAVKAEVFAIEQGTALWIFVFALGLVAFTLSLWPNKPLLKLYNVTANYIKDTKDTKGTKSTKDTKDITDLKKAEKEISQKESILRRIIEKSPAAIVVVDRDAVITYVSELIGMGKYELKEFIGQPLHFITDKIGIDYERSILVRALRGEVINGEFAVIEKREWLASAIAIRDAITDEITGAIGIYYDVEEQRKAQREKLQALAEFHTLFMNNVGAIAIIRSSDGTLADVNEAWERLTGFYREEAIGRTVVELGMERAMGQAEYLNFLASVQKVAEKSQSLRFFQKSGEERMALSSWQPIERNGEPHLVLTLVDITEMKRYEKEMARLDRLNLVGEMAASISHEIRNPMTTVRGYLQFMKGKPDLSRYVSSIEIMIDELDRANSIITEFLSLAKNKHIQATLFNINDIVNSIYPLLQSEALLKGHDIVFEAGSAPELVMDEKEIRQLILNLAKNGLEAMTGRGNILTIRTWQENRHVILSVSDQGPGIPAHIINQIGTPFVTTKETGTGLGLSVCFAIASRNHAKLTFDTGPEGTTFFLTFSDISDISEAESRPPGE